MKINLHNYLVLVVIFACGCAQPEGYSAKLINEESKEI